MKANTPHLLQRETQNMVNRWHRATSVSVGNLREPGSLLARHTADAAKQVRHPHHHTNQATCHNPPPSTTTHTQCRRRCWRARSVRSRQRGKRARI